MIGAKYMDKIGDHEIEFTVGYFKSDYKCKFCNKVLISRKLLEIEICLSDEEKIIKDIIE